MALNLACYAYQPVTGAPLAESQRIRVYLTVGGTTELARFLGPRVEIADGTLASIQPDGTLSVGVQSVTLSDGVRQPWSGEGVVAFPAQYVRQVERSELSRGRSIAGSVGLAVGLVVIAALALKTGGSQGSQAPGDGSPPALAPLRGTGLP